MTSTANRRIVIIAVVILVLDQLTKMLVRAYLVSESEKVIIRGFFKLVNWGNTGAAWSLFVNKNGLLAVVGILALVVLFWSRHHFEAHTLLGQVALGLVSGGILGNLTDRLVYHRVTDFLYFYLERRGAAPIGFPAFNVADSAICIGVGLIFISTLRSEKPAPNPPAAG